MSRPWRYLAIVVFASSVLAGAVAGERLLALSEEAEVDLKAYTELLSVIHENYGDEVLYRDLVYSSVQGMLRSLDPHTSFLSPEAYDDMRQRQQGSFFGLGILVSMRNGQLTVISPIEGTPAWRLGMRAGDVISSIEGEATSTMSLDEAVTKLKGPKDTQVNIQILRRGLDEPLALSITRAEIPQNTVRYAYMMTPDTAYLRLTDFSRSTSREVGEALERLKDEGMERLILDLRSNGGGLLDQTVSASGYFVPENSQIVETRGRVPNSRQSFNADGGQEMLDIPLVVLVNNGTASAAEILAGAIQDHDVGLIVGTPTWGKGLVQTVYNLSYGAGIALTTAKYYTPSGRLIQRDYSSYYDYYTHFDEGEGGEDVPEVEVDGPEFQTDLGRKVYGAGGISPDVDVEIPDGPSQLQALYAKNAFFNFAVDYLSRHQIADEGWRPGDDLMSEFRQWLVDEEIATEEDLGEIFEAAEARQYAQRQIHADIFTAAFGTEASHRVLAEGDAQIQAALGLFDQAAELLAQRHGLPEGRERFAASIDGGALEGRGQVDPDSGGGLQQD